MRTFKNNLQKFELPLFLVLTYALSWWSAPIVEGRIIPHGPALAAVIVIGLYAGKRGLGEWWQQATHLRIPLRWFLAGPAVVLAYHAVAFAINRLLGAQMASPPQLSMGTFFTLLLMGGVWEEPGWSGYLLPKLRERFAKLPNGLLVAAVVTGVIRSIWHLPLFLYGHIAWFDALIFSFAFQIIITWVFVRSGGSVPAVMLLHFASNLMGSFTYPMFTGREFTAYTVSFMSAATLFAIALVLMSKLKVSQPAAARA